MPDNDYKLPMTMVNHSYYLELLDTYLSLLREELHDDLISVCLYGSVARGTATRESDIDLLVIVREKKRSYYEMLEPLLRAEHRLRATDVYRRLSSHQTTPYFSYLVFSRDEAAINRNIYLDLLTEGRILYDSGDFLKQRLEQLKRRLYELGAKRVELSDGRWYWDLKPDLVLGMTFEL